MEVLEPYFFSSIFYKVACIAVLLPRKHWCLADLDLFFFSFFQRAGPCAGRFLTQAAACRSQHHQRFARTERRLVEGGGGEGGGVPNHVIDLSVFKLLGRKKEVRVLYRLSCFASSGWLAG